ncbi:ABC transporter substrate-binding protein [Aquabacter sp. CN5-332]|uniref:ABC transporter substrate-binding protein n=1 Tax=Aquabacter sp. CN5-332 TaxID=3156608 RepID=UPI0032B3FD95
MSDARSDLPVVKVNVFPGGFNWGVYVGIDKGFFAEHGIAVTVEGTPNSVTQMTDFSQGKFDIAMTAVDNIVAYVEGQGEAPIGPQPEFTAFMGSDNGFLSLVTQPAMSSVAALRGQVLSVDAMTTGYAFVLFDILRRAGIGLQDCSIVRVGGMIQRYRSLLAGNEVGTLLSAPYNLIAQANGLVELVKAHAVIGPYQGNVAAARRPWLAANRDKAQAYVLGYRKAIDWLVDPANKAEAIAVLRRNLPDMAPEVAEGSYGELLDPAHGFFRGCKIDMDGLKCVLELRSRYTGVALDLADPLKYCDLSFQ